MKILVSAFAILVGSNVATLSAEKVLKFKLATIFIGQKDGESHLMGVTVFPDGRLGTKEFFDKAGANGASTGRSTYFFDNGSIDVT
jgi:hypothetical protein